MKSYIYLSRYQKQRGGKDWKSNKQVHCTRIKVQKLQGKAVGMPLIEMGHKDFGKDWTMCFLVFGTDANKLTKNRNWQAVLSDNGA